MKPLYSTLKLIAFWRNACILHDTCNSFVFFFFFLFFFLFFVFFGLSAVRSTSVVHVLCVYIIQVNTPDHTFLQLTPEYKTILNIKLSCGITVQRPVNYGNLMNIFIYKNHVAYYSFSSTFPSECGPSTQAWKLSL